MEKDSLDHPLKAWQAIRERGILFFIIKRGIVQFAFPGALFYTWILSRRLEQPFMDILPRNLSLFIFAGFLFSVVIWFLMERKLKRYEQELSQ